LPSCQWRSLLEVNMSTETNKIMVRRFFEEVFNHRNLAVMDEILASDIVNHNTRVHGLENAKRLITSIIASYPDRHVTLDDFIAEGDKVCVRGTDQFTEPNGGKKVSIPWIEILRIEDGKAVEAWAVEDMSFFKEQLGQ